MFQMLDDKGSCVGIYKDGELYFNELPLDLDKTWNYLPLLKGKNIEYAYIYANGGSLESVCPQNLIPQFKNITSRLQAFLKSLTKAKVSLRDNCLYDLVPPRFLKEYCEVKNRICQHVFENYKKPSEYAFYSRFSELISDISYRDLQIDRNILQGRIYVPQAEKLLEKVNSGQTSIKFNMFSSVTGRLTVTDRSFPILTLPAKMRDIIKPTNDWFISLDLNAAEMRIALALIGKEQPSGDLHDHVKSIVFGADVTRSQAKTISTQWLYDARNDDTNKYSSKLGGFYDKNKLLSEYWKQGVVHTPYGRKIDSDNHHAISYLCQSTLIDLWHRQLIKLDNLLANKQSFIAFPLHDQVILDLKDSEKNLLPEISKLLSTTEWGEFPVKVEIGTNFGNLRKVNIKA